VNETVGEERKRFRKKKTNKSWGKALEKTEQNKLEKTKEVKKTSATPGKW